MTDADALAEELRRLVEEHPGAPLAWAGAVLAARDAQVRQTGREAVESVVGDYVASRRRATTTSGVEVVADPDAAFARPVELNRADAESSLFTSGRRRGDRAAAAPGRPRPVQARTRPAAGGHAAVAVDPAAGGHPRRGRRESRVADVVPVQMKIYDTDRGAPAVVPIDPDDLARGSVVVSEEVLGGRRQAIVGLMAEGRTERGIAARLDVSLRTVNREITALMAERARRHPHLPPRVRPPPPVAPVLRATGQLWVLTRGEK